jgi:hypothetical protein
MAWSLPNDARILSHMVPSQAGLPGVCGDRVLTYRKLAGKYVLYVLDFDQAQLASLVSKNSQERETLHAQLMGLDAQVKVITRRFQSKEEGVGGGFEDVEYSRANRPPAWASHILDLQKRDVEEAKIGIENNDALEYDEAPEEYREPMPFGFVQSVLRLGRNASWTDLGRMAITTGRVVLVPEPWQGGVIYDFIQ